MNDYVPKPFRISQLFAALAKATGREFTTARFTTSSAELAGKVDAPKNMITDLAYLRSFCAGDKTRMQKYITLFVNAAPDRIAKLRLANSKNDFEEIASQVHGYKTSLMMMGMHESKDLASHIERQCRAPMRESSIQGNVTKLIIHLQDATEELNRA